jgi:hypothetical protein
MTTTIEIDDATAAIELGAEIAREMVRRLQTSSGQDVALLAAKGALAELARAIEHEGGLPALRRTFQETYRGIARPVASAAA